MTKPTRYRIEDGVYCVDVRVEKLEQLFDNRDPAPFRERDLDPALVEYLFDAAEDLAGSGRFRVIFWFGADAATDKLEPAYRAHFAYELERLARTRARLRRTGHVSLVVAVAMLLALVSLAQLAPRIPGVGHALREGLTIAGWVVMWRPIQTLFYDWVPLRRDRGILTHLQQAPLDIRSGTPPIQSITPSGVLGSAAARSG